MLEIIVALYIVNLVIFAYQFGNWLKLRKQDNTTIQELTSEEWTLGKSPFIVYCKTHIKGFSEWWDNLSEDMKELFVEKTNGNFLVEKYPDMESNDRFYDKRIPRGSLFVSRPVASKILAVQGVFLCLRKNVYNMDLVRYMWCAVVPGFMAFTLLVKPVAKLIAYFNKWSKE